MFLVQTQFQFDLPAGRFLYPRTLEGCRKHLLIVKPTVPQRLMVRTVPKDALDAAPVTLNLQPARSARAEVRGPDQHLNPALYSHHGEH